MITLALRFKHLSVQILVVADADLVIGSVLIPGKSAPKLMKKEYLKNMHPSSVIVDVARLLMLHTTIIQYMKLMELYITV